ncbi:hypothetical protein EPUS_07688 [Endocarpon pusillum Z07020]|uniref:Uncharacterized protein n=1 Tax=Endocarpon pusillum (strain Z07020 / HMAS-L-300199) TaxID=1263415 RepID=U1HT99_ENDPU|nr:uncharacterized protein EPUS_07688 [Endocarpon pusillum Z07020]ERF72479.1 hypothetical protein EPUS_07688 [Endocarpon pusillum Z07020]
MEVLAPVPRDSPRPARPGNASWLKDASLMTVSEEILELCRFCSGVIERRWRREGGRESGKIFDSGPFWREFLQRKPAARQQEGLLGIQYLKSPEGFFAFVQATKQKCDALVAKTLAATSLDEYRAMARDMDRLSDLLCRVIDVSDFMRVFHQDAAIIKAATQAYEHMFEYMNVLNTTAGLNEQLKKALRMPEVRSGT